MTQVTIHRGRSKTLAVKLSYDLSEDSITSQLRQGRHSGSALLATWQVELKTDGKDGELILYLDDSVTAGLEVGIAYMDLKRVTAGEPVQVFDDPLQVVIKDVVTT